ncbi:hypothetical protein PspLS_05036 [Pyricularia sp. CBS 133598]|nr:hypothetical protein PspLS_05036 [Pyricularia sp. CBS 133598]
MGDDSMGVADPIERRTSLEKLDNPVTVASNTTMALMRGFGRKLFSKEPDGIYEVIRQKVSVGS